MSRVLLILTAVLLATPIPVVAQQGSVQISGSVQALTGDAPLLGGQHRLEPDIGVSWLQPTLRFGSLQLELRGTRRYDLFHLGRTHVALRDVKLGGATWAFEGGDSYFSPTISDYRFSNLFIPTVTFSGAMVSARTKRSNLNVVAGRATAWRNIFGSDPDSLQQTIATARAAHRPNDRLEVNLRASRIRTSDLREFAYSIAASDQVGGGIKHALTNELQLIADGSYVRYERVGTTGWKRDGSGLVGANWLHSRGWVQINASRFSPGDMPTLNSPLPDRSALFAAGEYDLSHRLRVLGGWELFRTNLDPEGSAESSVAPPRTTGSRQFAGLRLQVGGRSTLTLRAEDGARVSRPILDGFDSESDTGSLSAEWQAAVSRLNGFARYARRENVDRLRTQGSYTQHEASAQVFATVARSGQLFASAAMTHTEQEPGGNTHWEVGGGVQFQLNRRNLWVRSEAIASRNRDLFTERLAPRESFSFGVNGQLTPSTTIGVNLHIDRAPPFAASQSAWSTRSMIRITRTLRTGSARVLNGTNLPAALVERGTGLIRGLVYSDWNANGVQDPGEAPIEGIPVRVLGATQGATGRAGEFAFQNVPVGRSDVGLDLGALPVDFDPPAVAELQVDVVRNGAIHVTFGLIPLGGIRGKVIRDSNANNQPDAEDALVDGAVVILDEGARSEQSRKGVFAFGAVRSGDHVVKLLLESLPPGAVISGPIEHKLSLGRDRLTADVVFLVSIQQRPEIRRIFPGGSGGKGKVPDKGKGDESEEPATEAEPSRGREDESDRDGVAASRRGAQAEHQPALTVTAAQPTARDSRSGRVDDSSKRAVTLTLERQVHFDISSAARPTDSSQRLDREYDWGISRSSRGGCKLHRGYRARRRITYVKVKRLRRDLQRRSIPEGR